MATSLQLPSSGDDPLTAALRHGAAVAHGRGDLRLAEMLYREILGYRPQDAHALHTLERLRIGDASVRAPEAAKQSAQNDSEVRLPPSTEPVALLRRAAALQAKGRLLEALSCCDAALDAAPQSAAAHSLRGRIQREQGMLEAALESFLTALTQHDDPHTKFALGCLYLLCGDLDQGWPLYDQYRWAEKTSALAPRQASTAPRWNGEDVRGKTLRLVQDQDVSDTLQFARYALLAQERGATVVLVVQDRLCRLLQSLSPEMQVVTEGSAFEACDFECALSALPGLFGTTLETIPAQTRYLHAEPARARRWRERFAGKDFRIGICWRSEQATDADDSRSFSLHLLEAIDMLPGVKVISLQPTGSAPADELPSGMRIDQLGPDFASSSDTFEDTAAVIECLDLVITSDCAIAHLAGSLGTRTWVALPHIPDWRWMLERRDSPWYPSVRLFRQTAGGDYTTVMECMRDELSAMLDQHRARAVATRAPIAAFAPIAEAVVERAPVAAEVATSSVAVLAISAEQLAVSESASNVALQIPAAKNVGHWTARLSRAWARALRMAPQLVSGVLMAALTAELINTIRTFLPHDSGRNLVASEQRVNKTPRGLDVDPIVHAHLFGEVELAQNAAVKLAAVNLKLTGTLATDDPHHGLAIIGGDGKSSVYTVGQSVGDVALQAIYKDRVVIRHNGVMASLFLPRNTPSHGKMMASTQPASAAVDEAEPEATASDIGKYTRSKLETDVAGNLLGIRVVPGQDRAAFMNSGLIGGDIVVSMNGQKIDSEGGADIWKRAATGTAVTVLRAGVLKDITLNFGN